MVEKAPTDRTEHFDRAHAAKMVQHMQLAAERSVIPAAYQQQLQQEFDQLYSRGEALASMDDKALNQATKRARKQLKRNPEDIGKQLEFLACAAEWSWRTLGMYPHANQLLAIMNSMHFPEGTLSEVKTGEGKSLIFAMQSALNAAKGHKVEVVTTSAYLAERDCQKFYSFYDKLGFTTTHTRDHSANSDYSGDIVYSAMHTLVFDSLRDRAFDSGIRKDRPFDTILMDESDFLMLDEQSDYIISTGFDTGENKTWLYESLNHFVDSPRFKEILPDHYAPALRDWLKEHHPEQATDFDHWDDRAMAQYVESALAAKGKREGIDYVVQHQPDRRTPLGAGRMRAVIVDAERTGQLRPNSTWSHGVHQMLHARLGLPEEPENMTLASSSVRHYLDQYSHRFAITGTVGNTQEVEETQQRYSMKGFRIPSHKTLLRDDRFAKLAPDSDTYWQAIIDDIKEKQTQGRPILLAFDTIKASQEAGEKLQQAGIDAQFLNGVQDEPDSAVIRKAGAPGTVTIATIIAGRGIDIHLEDDVLERGGLHVSMGFLPDTERVEMQVRGRAGRQGVPGSSTIILNQQHHPYLSTSMPEDVLQEQVQALREVKTRFQSIQRSIDDYTGELTQYYKDAYFDMLKGYQQRVAGAVEHVLKRQMDGEIWGQIPFLSMIYHRVRGVRDTEAYKQMTHHLISQVVTVWNDFSDEMHLTTASLRKQLHQQSFNPEEGSTLGAQDIELIQARLDEQWQQCQQRMEEKLQQAAARINVPITPKDQRDRRMGDLVDEFSKVADVLEMAARFRG